MDPEGLSEEAAFSASVPIASAPLVAAGEAAESADDLAEAGADRGNWADLSEAPLPDPADSTGVFPEDLIDLGEPSTAAEEDAAFGASSNPPQEERFSALGLLLRLNLRNLLRTTKFLHLWKREQPQRKQNISPLQGIQLKQKQNLLLTQLLKTLRTFR